MNRDDAFEVIREQLVDLAETIGGLSGDHAAEAAEYATDQVEQLAAFATDPAGLRVAAGIARDNIMLHSAMELAEADAATRREVRAGLLQVLALAARFAALAV